MALPRDTPEAKELRPLFQNLIDALVVDEKSSRDCIDAGFKYQHVQWIRYCTFMHLMLIADGLLRDDRTYTELDEYRSAVFREMYTQQEWGVTLMPDDWMDRFFEACQQLYEVRSKYEPFV